MALTKSTYSQGEINAGNATAPQFQDATISPATVADGTLRQRFDPLAFPQKGIKYTGTDADGNSVPATARTVQEA